MTDALAFGARAPRLLEDDPLPPEDRVRSAAKRALEDLYRSEAPRLLRFFARRCRREDAQDLLQESFARFAVVEDRTAIACPEAYLSTIAANLLRNRAKSALQRTLALHVPADQVALTAPDLVAALEARDQLNRLQGALVRLRPKTRTIFLAHRLDGLTYNEIAKATGLSLKGVEWHMTKAIAHLDRAMQAR